MHHSSMALQAEAVAAEPEWRLEREKLWCDRSRPPTFSLRSSYMGLYPQSSWASIRTREGGGGSSLSITLSLSRL